MNGQHKKNLTVSEQTLSHLYEIQGLCQEKMKRKVTLSESVQIMIFEFIRHNYPEKFQEFQLEEKPQ